MTEEELVLTHDFVIPIEGVGILECSKCGIFYRKIPGVANIPEISFWFQLNPIKNIDPMSCEECIMRKALG